MDSSVWLTDGSPPVFSDTQKLRAWRRLGILPVRYEGLVDPAVPWGRRELVATHEHDSLFAEAEWYVEFEDGPSHYLNDPDAIDASTEVVMRAMIEGKWLNRLVGNKRWHAASVGNNLIAEGPGIVTRLGDLASTRASIEVLYDYEMHGAVLMQRQYSTLADLRGANVIRLIREAVRACGAAGTHIDGINLGANGPLAAVVNDRRRLRRSLFTAGRLPLPDARPHHAKDRLVRRALADGLAVPRGGTVLISAYDARMKRVGEGELHLTV